MELSDIDEEITKEYVKRKTCQFVHEICPSAEISHEDVLPVSGRWAYYARMLAISDASLFSHARYYDNVRKSLREVPNPTCGLEDDPYTCLDKLGDDVLSAKLEDASGITTLEERYSCF